MRVVPRESLSAHVLVCPANCPRDCGLLVAPSQREEHLRHCLALRVQCKALGCAWQGPRFEAQAHAATCPLLAVRPAVSLLQEKTTQLRDELDEVKVDLANVKTQLAQALSLIARITLTNAGIDVDSVD